MKLFFILLIFTILSYQISCNESSSIEEDCDTGMYFQIIRNETDDTWFLQFTNKKSNDLSLYTIIDFSYGDNIITISTDEISNTSRMVHVFSSLDSFGQSLNHSQCVPNTYGKTSIEQEGSDITSCNNIIATTCNSTTNNNQRIVVFWMKKFNETTWSECETTIDFTDPLDNRSMFMRNDGNLFLVTDPSNNKVDVYKHTSNIELQINHTHTIYPPDPSNVLFGSTVTCLPRLGGLYDGNIYRDLCVICDKEFNSGRGRCWVYNNTIDSPTLIGDPIDPISDTHNNFGGDIVTFISLIQSPHKLIVSYRYDNYTSEKDLGITYFSFDNITNSYKAVELDYI